MLSYFFSFRDLREASIDQTIAFSGHFCPFPPTLALDNIHDWQEKTLQPRKFSFVLYVPRRSVQIHSNTIMYLFAMLLIKKNCILSQTFRLDFKEHYFISPNLIKRIKWEAGRWQTEKNINKQQKIDSNCRLEILLLEGTSSLSL